MLGLAWARGVEARPPLPRGRPGDLKELLVPPGNPVRPERVALGPELYFDKRRPP